MKNNGKTILFYVVLIIVILFASYFLLGTKEEKPPEYSEIVTMFENGEVEAYNVTAGNVLDIKTRDKTGSNGVTVKGKEISVKLRSLELFERDIKPIVYELNHDDDPDNDITSYNYEPPKETSLWLSFLPYILMIVFFVVLWFFAMNSAMGGKGGKINSFGKSRARVNLGGKNKVMFTDVAGADEEKEELKEVVDFLKNPKKFTELGAKIPRGVLLVGPPGTGKTLLAKAVAGEANVPFFSISGSDFVEMYVGVGASRVRDLFETAKKTAPAIVFIDEIDAVGRHRGAGLGGGHDEREQTLNQLLVEMDGFAENDGIIVIAATNRPDILDPALLRPGRFDRQVTVNYPDIRGREEILKVHARNKPLEKDVDLSVIAKTTAGFTGADLANLLNEAALLAARKSKHLIGMKELEEAMIKVIVGPHKKSKVISDKSKKLTAYHEAGHAVASFFLPGHDEVHQISIIPAGRAGGYTLYLPKEDRDYMSKGDMENELVSLLGGRVAEKLTLDDISTGASNDIQRATDIARSMVTKYGMSETLGPIVYGENQEEVFLGMSMTHSRNYSETVAAEIDAEVRTVIERAYRRTEKILSENMEKLTFIAEYLITHELMDEDQFRAVMNGNPTVEELEEIAKQKNDNSDKQNADAHIAKAKKTEKAAVMPESDDGDTAARDNIRRRIAEESQEMISDNAADTDDKTDNDTPDNSAK
ncbi:MAG: ATP-dependent zinc metalloprotease FtsH [Eubacteriales bacterium]|jgi:cell division protease FtsH